MDASGRTKRSVPPYWSPAIKQVASESPDFRQQFIEAAPWYQKVLEETQREIVASPDVKSILEELKAKGILPARVVKHAAQFVLLEKAPWRWNLEENKKRLHAVAKRLRKIADEVEATYRSDAIRPDLWAMQLGVLAKTVPPCNTKKAIKGMRQTAADLTQKAQGFGRVRHLIGPAVRRQPVVSLLRHVYRATWTNWNDENKDARRNSREKFRRDCLQPLAELLDAVCEKHGIKKTPTSESLEKLFIRYVLPELTRPDSKRSACSNRHSRTNTHRNRPV